MGAKARSFHQRSRKLFGLTFLFVFVGGGIARAETMSLEQTLALAYMSNPRLEQQRATLRATDEDVARALSGWRPSIAVTGSYGFTSNDIAAALLPIPNGHPRDVTVTVTQPIFNGSTIPQVRQARASVAAGRAQLTSVEQSVLLSAAHAYVDVIGDEAGLRFRRENVAVLEQQLNTIQERVNIGDITRTDLTLVQSRLSAAKAEVAFAEAKLGASRAQFAHAVGQPAATLDVSPSSPDIPAGEEQALGRAIADNPDLVAAREQARAADAAVDVASGAFLPSLSVQGQYKNSRDEVATGIRDSSLAVVAQLRVPLYQAGEEYANIRKAKETRNAAAYAINDVERQVRQALDTAWQAHMAAKDAITSYEQQVEAAEMAYEGFAEGLRAGERTTFDVLNSAQEVLTARISLAEARRQFYVNSFELAVAMGGLTARSLNLPVQFYDPQIHYDKDAGRWIGTGE